MKITTIIALKAIMPKPYFLATSLTPVINLGIVVSPPSPDIHMHGKLVGDLFLDVSPATILGNRDHEQCISRCWSSPTGGRSGFSRTSRRWTGTPRPCTPQPALIPSTSSQTKSG
jgi:hypothetical protein